MQPHHVTGSARLASFAFAASLIVSTPAFSLDVPPGTTSPPLQATACIEKTGAFENLGDLSCSPSICFTHCDASENTAEANLNFTNFTVGRRFAETTVYAEFTVPAGQSSAGHEVDGTIAYDVEWRAIWFLIGVLTGFNDAQSIVTLNLWDLSDGGKLLREVEVHRLEADAFGSLPEIPLEPGAGLDKGTSSNTLTSKLIRGRSYRIGLKVRLEGKGLANAIITLDYMSGQSGVWWNELRVSVSPDLIERIEILEHQLRHHTHTYLTGRGEGHNNTEAATSEAVIVDEGPPSEGEANVLPPVAPDAQPLPGSVVVTSAPNPFNPVATISYRLPEPVAVTLRVFDSHGRLVVTLEDGEKTAGPHEARFDAAGLSTGVYYCRLTAGKYSETRKLTLLK